MARRDLGAAHQRRMTATALLVRQLDLAFNTRSWHGPNLLGSLRGVTPGAAVWRPQPDRHNINEVVLHAAYWKYRVCRLITATDVPAFELDGADFFERPVQPTPPEWTGDLDLLKVWHQRLRTYTRAIPPRRLSAKKGSHTFSIAEVVSGAAAHDFYHAGQIRLLRRMFDDR